MKFAYTLLLISCLSVIASGFLKDIPIFLNSEGKVDENDYKAKYPTWTDSGKKATAELATFLAGLATKYKDASYCAVAPMKSMGSLLRKLSSDRFKVVTKLNKKYRNFEEVTDLVRSSFIVNDITKVGAVIADLKAHYPKNIKEVNRFEDKNAHYKDANLVFLSTFTVPKTKEFTENYETDKDHKLPMEIQVHLCGNFLAKGFAHATYEVTRLAALITKQVVKTFSEALNDMGDKDGKAFAEVVADTLKLCDMMKDTKAKEDLQQWNTDRDSKLKSQEVITSLTALGKQIYAIASKNEIQADCKKALDAIIDNKKCSYDETKFKVAAETFIRDVIGVNVSKEAETKPKAAAKQ